MHSGQEIKSWGCFKREVGLRQDQVNAWRPLSPQNVHLWTLASVRGHGLSRFVPLIFQCQQNWVLFLRVISKPSRVSARRALRPQMRRKCSQRSGGPSGRI